jgi:DNA topoisomerase-3
LCFFCHFHGFLRSFLLFFCFSRSICSCVIVFDLFSSFSFLFHRILFFARGYNNPRSGHDAGDHPPITPVGVARGGDAMSGDNGRIYDLVVTHFLATVSYDATYLQTKARFRSNGKVSLGSSTATSNEKTVPPVRGGKVAGSAGGATSGSYDGSEEFTVIGRRLIDPGFLALYGSSLKSPDSEGGSGGEEGDEDAEDFSINNQELPELLKDYSYQIANCHIREGKTSSPGYLTESELIGMMEKNGIGTDASIPTHINNVLTRNYVTLGPGRTLVPTDLGIVLVHGYFRIDPDLVLPDVRAAIESFCNLIAKGIAKKDEV